MGAALPGRQPRQIGGNLRDGILIGWSDAANKGRVITKYNKTTSYQHASDASSSRFTSEDNLTTQHKRPTTVAVCLESSPCQNGKMYESLC